MKRQDLQKLNLSANVDLDALWPACNAAIQGYLDGTGAAQARQWKHIYRLAGSKIVGDLREAISALSSDDPETAQIQPLAAGLRELRDRASRRVRYYGPVSEKGQLYVQIMRAWTNAGGILGASSEGPSQRLLCFVAKQVNQELTCREEGGVSFPHTKLKLGPRGAREIIAREQERRVLLTVLKGSENWKIQGSLRVDGFVVDRFGNRKD